MKHTIWYSKCMSGLCIVTHIFIISIITTTTLFSQECQADVRTRSKWLEKEVAVKEQSPQKHDCLLSVFPNPATDHVLVDFEQQRLVERVMVYNVSGSLVHIIDKGFTGSTVKIDTHLLAVGFYSVHLFCKKGVLCCSFIKII